MKAVYAPPGFVALDVARAILFFCDLDIYSRYLIARREYERTFDSFWTEIQGKRYKDLSDAQLNRLSYQESIALMVSSVGDILKDRCDIIYLQISHPLMRGDLPTPEHEIFNSGRVSRILPRAWTQDYRLYYSELIEKENTIGYGKLPRKLKDIIFRFRDLLSLGDIKGYIIDKDGDQIDVPRNYWNTEAGGEVLEYDTNASILHEGKLCTGRIIVDSQGIENFYETNVADINRYLSEKYGALERIAKDNSSDPVEAALHSGSYARIGAPKKYDENLFLVKVFEAIWFGDGTPATKEKLTELAVDAYVKANGPGGTPGDSWAKSRVRFVWETMRLRPGQKDGVTPEEK